MWTGEYTGLHVYYQNIHEWLFTIYQFWQYTIKKYRQKTHYMSEM
jgi:hypothetical protein